MNINVFAHPENNLQVRAYINLGAEDYHTVVQMTPDDAIRIGKEFIRAGEEVNADDITKNLAAKHWQAALRILTTPVAAPLAVAAE